MPAFDRLHTRPHAGRRAAACGELVEESVEESVALVRPEPVERQSIPVFRPIEILIRHLLVMDVLLKTKRLDRHGVTRRTRFTVSDVSNRVQYLKVRGLVERVHSTRMWEATAKRAHSLVGAKTARKRPPQR